jgi:2'-5' RNA ligase
MIGAAKYFIGIIPPSPIYEEALDWKKFFQSQFNSRAALRSPPHITLHMPFEWKSAKEHHLVESLSSFSDQFKPFQIELQGFGSFPPRVIYIQVVENLFLLHFQNQLVQHCKTELNLFNANRKEQPYHPHLTVAFRDLKKSFFPEAWNLVKDELLNHSFNCQGFALLRHNGKNWEVKSHFNFP